MKNPADFLTHTLRSHPRGEMVTRVMAAAIQAVDPAHAVRKYLAWNGRTLRVGDMRYTIPHGGRVYLVGAGKAGYPMVQAAAEILGDRLDAGVVVVKEDHTEETQVGAVEIVEAGHPLPDAHGIAGTEKIVSLLSRTQPDDLVLCMISGGGSALLTQPVSGVTLDDLRTLTDQLLASGATIHEFNILRKHLSRVKGGQLAERAAPARLAALILSDVVGNDLDIIASGPTVPDRSTFADAWNILHAYDLIERAPFAIREHLEAGKAGRAPETPKPGELIFARVKNLLVGSNELAAQAALKQIRKEKLRAHLLTTSMQGEADDRGRWLTKVARQIVETGRPVRPPVCLVAGGETTVTLRGAGRGGRNQQVALATVRNLADMANVLLVTLATDGGDGPTDAAGAVVSGETLARATARGLDPDSFLAHNDAYSFFDTLGDLLKPGPTQTNVNDLTFLFVF
jgi:hydroxypyruvate reductase